MADLIACVQLFLFGGEQNSTCIFRALAGSVFSVGLLDEKVEAGAWKRSTITLVCHVNQDITIDTGEITAPKRLTTDRFMLDINAFAYFLKMSKWFNWTLLMSRVLPTAHPTYLTTDDWEIVAHNKRNEYLSSVGVASMNQYCIEFSDNYIKRDKKTNSYEWYNKKHDKYQRPRFHVATSASGSTIIKVPIERSS
ncbi:hypothetical protein BYT27DRAFT_7257652 [Phlegmacium glaucopus]|nr:hypothetical protein BYT27DRAFT_7257652 [Phlegmacium glaucopus]